MRNPAILAISAVAATVIVLAPAGTCGNSRPAGSAGPAASPETKAVAGLRDLARAGSVLLDGDECMEIVTDRAAEFWEEALRLRDLLKFEFFIII